MSQAANGADSEPPDGTGDSTGLGLRALEAAGARIDVQIAATPAPDAGALSRWAAAALGRDRRALCMRVVDEPEGAALNARFRGGSGATNVLSFPAGEDGLLGDIAICAPVVAAEASAQRKPLEAHYAHMVIHGVFHLRGMDHADRAGAARMEARETALMRTLGFRDPYAAP